MAPSFPRRPAGRIAAIAAAVVTLPFPSPTAADEADPADPAPPPPSEAAGGAGARDGSDAMLAPVIVVGKAQNLLGRAASASKGQAGAAELSERPFLRRGELLEVVPGMVVTQHSGGGKANQYFVRGFNLDHGTDFGIFVEGMPVNNRSHGHGQGYADINFIIPELLERLDYVKGPYFARLGDFTSAGAAEFRFFDVLPEGIARATVGEDAYYRGVFADSLRLGPGDLTVGVEYSSYDGPWVMPEDFSRWNGMTRWHWAEGGDRFSILGLAYSARWDATDQVPERLIDRGVIDRLGFVDPTVGGDSQRYSLSVSWDREGDAATTRTRVYGGYYDLDLFSNFTYFLEDPVDGDQFNQVDGRWFAGGEIARTWRDLTVAGRPLETTVGIQTHHDWIDDVGLHHTRDRHRLSTVREDDVYQMNVSGFVDGEVELHEKVRFNAGIRGDLHHFDVAGDLPANSGSEWDGIVSPKASLVFGPWAETEFYLNGGLGFHSNDARGVVARVDPATGEPADAVDPLVRTYGAEFGIRTQIVPDLTSTLSVWYLESESELLYVGDAGNTEAGPATHRYGFEWANYWRPTSWFGLDAEVTVTESRFNDTSDGAYVENAVPVTFSGGLVLGEPGDGPFASFRARYFSERPLTADRSVESADAFQVNGRIGWRHRGWEISLEALNLFDAGDNDIEYFYASRLPGEPAGGIEDIHLHPIEPRTFRVSVTRRW